MTLPVLRPDHWIHQHGLYVLDTETTGVDVETALVASISGGRMNTDGTLPAPLRTDYIAVDMPAEASAVNGLTTEFLAEHGGPAAIVLDRFVDRIALALLEGRALVIANAAYDLTALDRECRRHGLLTLHQRLAPPAPSSGVIGPVVDPIVMDKRAIKYRKRVSKEQGARQLKTLCQVHGVGWDDELAHTSEYDAVQAGKVALVLLAEYPVVGALGPVALHASQRAWYYDQAESLAGYFQRESVQAEGRAAQAGQTLGGEEAAAAHMLEAAALRVKARSVTTDWPMRPYVQPAPVAVPEISHVAGSPGFAS
jgi:DNA polymerase-3 subunit epsilon